MPRSPNPSTLKETGLVGVTILIAVPFALTVEGSKHSTNTSPFQGLCPTSCCTLITSVQAQRNSDIFNALSRRHGLRNISNDFPHSSLAVQANLVCALGLHEIIGCVEFAVCVPFGLASADNHTQSSRVYNLPRSSQRATLSSPVYIPWASNGQTIQAADCPTYFPPPRVFKNDTMSTPKFRVAIWYVFRPQHDRLFV